MFCMMILSRLFNRKPSSRAVSDRAAAGKWKAQGIAFQPDMLEAAKARAKEQRRSLSNYIRGLIQDDINNSNK